MLTTLGQQALKSVALGLAFSISLPVAEDLDVELKEVVKRWPDRPIDVMGASESDGTVILCHMQMHYRDETEEKKTLDINLDCNKYEVEGGLPSAVRRRLTRALNSVSAIMAVLESHAADKHFHCTLGWRFPVDSVTPIIHLPLMQIPIPGTPFEQVSGVRLTSSTPDVFQYAVLDLESEDQLHLTIRFEYHGSFSPSTIDTAIGRGEELRKSIVKWKDTETE